MGQTVRQVRHFYVANKFTVSDGFTPDKHLDTVGDLGEMKAFINDSKNHLYFEYRGHGGVTRTDLIPLKHITYVNLSKKEDLRLKLKAYKVTFPSLLTTDHFSVCVKVSGLKNLAEYDAQQVIAHFDANSVDAIKEMAIHLAKGIEKTLFNVLEVFISSSSDDVDPGTLVPVTAKSTLATLNSATAEGIVIKEAKPEKWNEYNRFRRIMFEVVPSISAGKGPQISVANLDYTSPDNYVGNGISVVDDEYFYLGVRGQQYPIMAGYLASSLGVAEQNKEYDILDIHYVHQGPGETNIYSEKDITIAGKLSELETIFEKVKGAKETTLVQPTAPKKGPALEEC